MLSTTMCPSDRKERLQSLLGTLDDIIRDGGDPDVVNAVLIAIESLRASKKTT